MDEPFPGNVTTVRCPDCDRQVVVPVAVKTVDHPLHPGMGRIKLMVRFWPQTIDHTCGRRP